MEISLENVSTQEEAGSLRFDLWIAFKCTISVTKSSDMSLLYFSHTTLDLLFINVLLVPYKTRVTNSFAASLQFV